MKTKLQIIDETEAAYADPINRGMGDTGCMYLTPGGNRCAVGRCLIPGCSLEESGNYIESIDAQELEESLRPEYRGHSREFWEALQFWHDSSEHFTKIGISECGLKALDDLREHFSE